MLGHLCQSLADLLEMQLIYPAPVGLGNRHQKTVDLNLLARFGEMTQQMSDVAADCADISAFQFQAGGVVQFVQA